MKIQLSLELEVETGRLAVYAPLSTPEERDSTVKMLAMAIPIALNHRPPKIVPPPPGFNPSAKNGTPPLAKA